MLFQKDIAGILKIKMFSNELVAVVKFLIGRRSFRYFNHSYIYDNPSAPFNILRYPIIVINDIIEPIDIDIRNVLDIGGNTGQLPITLFNLCDSIERIDVFEPNGGIFRYLEKNCEPYDGIHAYNYGIGATNVNTMFVPNNRSAKGSIIRENAHVSGVELNEIDITLVSKPSRYTNMNSYDLLIIDVEGYEYEVLETLADISTRYMLIELASNSRTRSYTTSAIYHLIEMKWGAFEIVRQGEIKSKTESYDVLIKFI